MVMFINRNFFHVNMNMKDWIGYVKGLFLWRASSIALFWVRHGRYCYTIKIWKLQIIPLCKLCMILTTTFKILYWRFCSRALHWRWIHYHFFRIGTVTYTRNGKEIGLSFFNNCSRNKMIGCIIQKLNFGHLNK